MFGPRKFSGRRTISHYLLLTAVICGALSAVRAQLPDEAALPAGKGGWAVQQKFKTSIGGTYIPGYVNVIVQSDNTVFHRKFFDTGQPATPWCEDKFTDQDMREIRGAVAKFKSGIWAPNYGPFINALAPFRVLIMTTRDAKGNVLEDQTTLWRFHDLPADITAIANAVDTAGDRAFADCQRPGPPAPKGRQPQSSLKTSKGSGL